VRALIQRVSGASVTVEGETIGRIAEGLVVLLGVGASDEPAQATRLADKIAKLRVFDGDSGRMDRSLLDLGAAAGALCVSQFTLYGDTRKGNRPSFVDAAPLEEAEPLYERVRAALGAAGGVFGARMAVSLVNDGPVTLLIET
jgi:D-aminoacyl-tRNA deacylase